MQNYEQLVRQRADSLLAEYSQIVSEIFPGVVAVPEFLNTFNAFFTEYQHSKQRKMAPESLREGKVSCSSAAGLLGVWWYVTNGTHPLFILDNMSLEPGYRSSAHVKVGVSATELPYHPDDIAYYHYIDTTKARGLMPVRDPSTCEPNRAIIGNTGYLRNRVRTLGVKSNVLKKALTT